MDFYLTMSIGLLGICIGVLIGLGISFKINRDYILGMNDIAKEYLREMINLEKEYLDIIATDLVKAVDNINKVYEKPN